MNILLVSTIISPQITKAAMTIVQSSSSIFLPIENRDQHLRATAISANTPNKIPVTSVN